MRRHVLVRSAAVMIGIAGLLTAGLLVNASAGAQSAATTSAAAPAASGPTDIDHFTCYISTTSTSTTTKHFAPQTGVEIVNQFAPNGYFSGVGALAWHCNPAKKTVAGTVTPIVDPTTHLACFTMPVTAATSVAQPSYTVVVSNQFGQGSIVTGRPVLLCLPSWKNLRTPSPVTQPPLDHYVCYAVTNNANFPPAPKPVTLADQFNPASTPTTVTQFGPPNLLCVPSLKSPIDSPVGPVPPTLLHPEAHLLCFPIVSDRGAPTNKTVVDQNQFGIGTVIAKTLHELCVPSFKTFTTTTPPTGAVEITKFAQTAAGGPPFPLMGATFTAYTTAAKTVAEGTCTTDASGTCQITGLPAGTTPTISETGVPSGFTGSADQTVTITNPPGPVAITFTDTPG